MAQLDAGAGVAQVVNRCRSAKEDKRLDLSDCKLVQVPEAVYFLMKNVGVESINLTNNAIPRLPTKFAVVFPQLTELYLQRNNLRNLPDELKELTNLEMLDISYNIFTRLPSVTYKFSKLKFLNAENNSITGVDTEQLHDMSNLEEVNLYNNPLPDDLQQSLSSEVLFTVLVGERPQDEDDDEDEEDEDDEEEEEEEEEEESEENEEEEDDDENNE